MIDYIGHEAICVMLMNKPHLLIGTGFAKATAKPRTEDGNT
jgi:hypothetical protein